MRFHSIALTAALGIVSGAVVGSGARAAEPAPTAPLCSFPFGETDVTVTKLGAGTAHLVWYVQMESFTDIVRGSLESLAASRGDYRIATSACIKEDDMSSTFGAYDDPDLPQPGTGFWYLLRADWDGGGCPLEQGTYDSLEGRQVGYRDYEVLQSGHDCNCFYSEGPCWVPPR